MSLRRRRIDDVHPTAAAHQLIADAALAVATEPSAFTLASLGAIGVAFWARRQRRPIP